MTFAEFYALYPRKIGKKAAEKAWNQLHVTVEMEKQICAILEKRKQEDWKGRNMKFIPYPGTFLRAEGFDEEVEAKADDPLVSEAAGVSVAHAHRCLVCVIPHNWLHDDPFCWMTPDVACDGAIAALPSRKKAVAK